MSVDLLEPRAMAMDGYTALLEYDKHEQHKVIENVRSHLRCLGGIHIDFVRKCFRLGNLGALFNGMYLAYKHMTDNEELVELMLIAEEILLIQLRIPGSDTSHIPHYAELMLIKETLD